LPAGHYFTTPGHKILSLVPQSLTQKCVARPRPSPSSSLLSGACQGVGRARRNDEGLQKDGIPTFINALKNGEVAPIPDARRSGVLLRSSADSGPSSHEHIASDVHTSGHATAAALVRSRAMSKLTPRSRWRSPSLDDLVGAGERGGRNFEAETSFQVSNGELVGRRCR